jgi:hypothetical protein
MEKEKISPSNRWLYGLAALFILLFIILGSGSDPLFPIRMAGFFLLTQLLIQVIFPQFRCSKVANLNVTVIIIVTFILMSLNS